MTDSTLRLARVAAVCLFVAAAAVWAYQVLAAACTADLKGGAWGNPTLALELETQAVLLGLAASGMLGVAFALFATPGSVATRAFRFLAGAIVCFGVLLVAGFFLEIQSTTSCGAPVQSRSSSQ